MPLSRRFRHRRQDWVPDPPMNTLTCASCGEDFTKPAARVRLIVVCPHCGASSFITVGGRTRVTTGADITDLSPADLQVLRLGRRSVVRGDQDA